MSEVIEESFQLCVFTQDLKDYIWKGGTLKFWTKIGDESSVAYLKEYSIHRFLLEGNTKKHIIYTDAIIDGREYTSVSKLTDVGDIFTGSITLDLRPGDPLLDQVM